MGQHGRGNVSDNGSDKEPHMHGAYEEPRRTGSLGRKSDHVMTPWAGETMGYRDTHWGA